MCPTVFTDPIFDALNDSACARADKVFVEPIPALYRKLERNLRAMPRAVAIQAAISTRTNRSSELPMYCLIDPESAEIDSARLKSELHHRVKIWWDQICSLSRDRLFAQVEQRPSQ